MVDRNSMVSRMLLIGWLAWTSAVHAADCGHDLDHAGPVEDRTRAIANDSTPDVRTHLEAKMIARMRDDAASLFHGWFTVVMGPLFGQKDFYGPLNFLRPEEFDDELRVMIVGLLREAKSEERIRPGLLARVARIRRERAEALRYHRAHPGLHAASSVATWRDQSTVKPEARACFRNGIEVGFWVMTYESGRRVILPYSSSTHDEAFCRLNAELPFRIFLKTLPPGEVLRSAAFFHNHPGGCALLSYLDVEAISTFAIDYRKSVREFHVYAVAETDQGIQISHYGKRRYVSRSNPNW